MSTAKRTPETLKIAERLEVLASKVKLLALAANGIDDANDDAALLASEAFEIESEIWAIAGAVHPPPTAKEMARVERAMAKLSKGGSNERS